MTCTPMKHSFTLLFLHHSIRIWVLLVLMFFKTDFFHTEAILFCNNTLHLVCENTCIIFLFTCTVFHTVNSPNFNYASLPSYTDNRFPPSKLWMLAFQKMFSFLSEVTALKINELFLSVDWTLSTHNKSPRELHAGLCANLELQFFYCLQFRRQ